LRDEATGQVGALVGRPEPRRLDELDRTVVVRPLAGRKLPDVDLVAAVLPGLVDVDLDVLDVALRTSG
jgi:hypothetical protein